ncbi:MAG: SCP2 sterol-binding domain-containing protein [Thermoanaerobaculia bacterium]|nr:SCP2 sterol-binding domain-containing protein [Thermoanaerobaculia bacterium]
MSDTATAVKEIFDAMPERLNPKTAEGLDCIIQHDLGGDGGGQWYATIKDGACGVTEGSHDSPTMTITMEAADFVALTRGDLDGMSAFMSGKLRIGGDMGLAMKLQSLFS